MGSQKSLNPRVVLDSTIVVSALCFPAGRLRWLMQHWRIGCTALISQSTAAEVTRVLAYPKFRLSAELRYEFLAEYVPFCETVEVAERCPAACRDTGDQPFLDLAQSGKADVLVTGDSDLLALAGQTQFAIETPEAYRRRTSP